MINQKKLTQEWLFHVSESHKNTESRKSADKILVCGNLGE